MTLIKAVAQIIRAIYVSTVFGSNIELMYVPLLNFHSEYGAVSGAYASDISLPNFDSWLNQSRNDATLSSICTLL